MGHVIIIGNGISGITAARHIRKRSNKRITVISAETDYFFSRTALMYIYMGHMKFEHTKPYEDWFWEKNRINLKRAFVQSVQPEANSITLNSGEVMQYDNLVIASGSSPNKFGWPGQDFNGVQGLYSFQDLELMEKNTAGIEHAVIVGGGLIGIEMAEMLRTRNIGVTMFVRESSFWNNVLPKEESELINKHISDHHVELRLSTELKEIHSDENGTVNSITTTNGESIDCQFVGLTVGVHPNISFLENSGIDVERGIKVNRQLQTNFKNIYAIGDCAQQTEPVGERRNIEQVWYTGKMMGETVAATICGKTTDYQPGIWFNSAKFFDIEYQTYGWVFPTLRENEASFFWSAKDKRRCLRLVYDKTSKAIIGINAFGLRLRHEVCNNWIEQSIPVQQVIKELDKANFDPEFFKKFEKEVQSQFQSVST
jgi:NADPH-dependent 2,4-dienoyl-CoA reductase/sulfur reductase-like enzyme